MSNAGSLGGKVCSAWYLFGTLLLPAQCPLRHLIHLGTIFPARCPLRSVILMTLIICPGLHDSKLTDELVRSLNLDLNQAVINPTHLYPPYSALHLLQFLNQELMQQHIAKEILFLSFSAGVVGAIGAAWAWQATGKQVKGVIALDGWGVPLYGNFPIHRLSHDSWTHLTTNGLEWLSEGFYADPPVPHLELWRSPSTAQGWWVNYGTTDPIPPMGTVFSGLRAHATAAEVLLHLLARYGE